MSKQTQQVIDVVMKCIENGFTNKSEIYTRVEQETCLPRPTIRRATRELRTKLLEIVKILEPVNPPPVFLKPEDQNLE